MTAEYDKEMRSEADMKAERRKQLEEEIAGRGPTNRRSKADRKGLLKSCIIAELIVFAGTAEEEDNEEEHGDLKRERDLQKRLETAIRAKSTTHVFCIVLMTDGADTVNSSQELNRIIDGCGKQLTGIVNNLMLGSHTLHRCRSDNHL